MDAITALEKSIFLKTIRRIKNEVLNQVKDQLLRLIDYNQNAHTKANEWPLN